MREIAGAYTSIPTSGSCCAVEETVLPRYQPADPYAVEELRREYLASDSRGRIGLIRKRLKDGDLPYEILSLAMGDEQTAVRRWIALHAPLSGEDCKTVLNDVDPFIRASAWENPNCVPVKGLMEVDWDAINGATPLAARGESPAPVPRALLS